APVQVAPIDDLGSIFASSPRNLFLLDGIVHFVATDASGIWIWKMTGPTTAERTEARLAEDFLFRVAGNRVVFVQASDTPAQNNVLATYYNNEVNVVSLEKVGGVIAVSETMALSLSSSGQVIRSIWTGETVA